MQNVWKALCVGVVLAGCGGQDDLPPDAVRTAQYDVVEVESGAGVEIVRGGAYGYRIPDDSSLEIDVAGRTARVRNHLANRDTMIQRGAVLYVDELTEIRLSGKNVVTMNDVSTRRFVARLSGQSELHLMGVAEHLEAHFTGLSQLFAKDLEARHAMLRGSGNGWCEVTALDGVDAHLTGNAVCELHGQPEAQQVQLEDEAALKLR